MFIREIEVADVEKLTRLIQQVEAESEYMLMEPGERKATPEQHRQRIETMKKSDNSTIIVSEEDGDLVGYMFAIGGTAKRNQHTVYLVVGILKDYRGKGIGTHLFEKLNEWAVKQKIHRLELTVVTLNETAVALYKKMGFQIEGTKKHSLLVGGEFVDEYYMAKLLQ